MAESESLVNLRAHVLFEVMDEEGSPLAAVLLAKPWVESVRVDDRRRIIEAVIQATDREGLSAVTGEALTTAGRMSAGFRGILISDNGRAPSGSWWLGGESRLLCKSVAGGI